MNHESRLKRLESATAPSEPTIFACPEGGEKMALVDGAWIPWPDDRPLPRVCKVFLCHPEQLDL